MNLSDKKLSEVITSHGDITVHEAWRKGMFDKPESKKIDMSVCIESAIECEFRDNDCEFPFNIGRLKNIFSHSVRDDRWSYISHKRDIYTKCRPRFNHIHCNMKGWEANPMPVGFRVRVWIDARTTKVYNTSESEWDSNVIAFEVLNVEEGFEP